MGRWVTLVFLVLLSGCYEGWDENAQPTPNNQLPQLPSAPKPIAYLLLQPIQLDASAMADAGCFPKTGLRDFRATEWSLRLDAATTALAKIADTLAVQPIAIGKGDCNKLDTVTRAAQSAAPWGTSTAPAEDAAGRMTVHLTMAFSEEEPGISPASAVTALPWAAFGKLAARGIGVVSLRYFVVSNGGSGYYTDWRTAIANGDLKRDGTAIDAVDPTEAGQEARASRVDVDTQDLAQWVLEHAQ